MATTSVTRQKNAARTKQRESCRTAFVKQYDVPIDYSFPGDFDLSKNSILFAESIRGTHNSFLFLYWSSAERALALEPKVEKDLGTTNGRVVGYIVQILTPQKPKWLESPAKWGQWLVTVAAIFGALSVIQDHFTDLFGRPHVVIFASDKATRNFHAGDLTDFPIEFRNQATFGHVDVHIDKVQFRPSERSAPSVPVQFSVSDLPQIQAGQCSEIHLSGSPAGVRDSKLQHYILAIQATAKEGTFWPSAKVDSIPFEVTLWPDRMDEFQVTRVAPNVVRVEIKVGSGIALDKGLRGQLTQTSTAAPESGGIILTGATSGGDPIVAASPSEFSVKVQFQTPQLQPFRPTSVTVTLAFQGPLTETQWNQLQASTKVVVE
jgi:hypothetical protein